ETGVPASVARQYVEYRYLQPTTSEWQASADVNQALSSQIQPQFGGDIELRVVTADSNGSVSYSATAQVTLPGKGLWNVSTNGLYIHYNFDDIVSNKVADKSGNGLDLTLNSSSYSDDAISGLSLAPYNNQSATLTLNSAQQIDLANTDFTLSYWIKTTLTDDSWGRYKLFPDGNYSSLFITSAGDFKLQFMTQNQWQDQWISEANTLIPNRWQMISYVRQQSGEVAIYIDGQLRYQGNHAAGNPITTLELNSFSGAYLDELRIYKRALSGEEITSLYNTPTIGTVPEAPTDIDSQTMTGGELWQALNCAQCHGSDGNAQGSSILNALFRDDIIDLLRDTMPYGNPSSCDQTCAEKLYDWMVDEFIDGSGGSGGTPVTPPATISGLDATITDAEAAKLFYRAALNLNGRLPTEQERQQLQQQGTSALSDLLDQLLNDDAFSERIAEIYQDVVHTAGLSDALNQVDYFAQTRGSSSKWYQTAGAGNTDLYNFLYKTATASHQAETTELIEYVVKNRLPFSDILTADYTMVNYYTARSYGIEGQFNFRQLSDPEWPDYPWDINDFQPVDLGISHSGLMTNPAYMGRHPSTATNLNRHRSYKFYKNFLDTDILSIGGKRPTADDLAGDLPTMTNPACTGCHLVMDPVASSFQHWQSNNVYIAKMPKDTWSGYYWPENRILPAGFNGELAPMFTDSDPLPWLMQKAVADPRFSLSVVKTLFEPITGYPVKTKPLDSATETEKSYYASQQQDINNLAARFRLSNYDVRGLVKDLLTSAYAQRDNPFGGTMRLLTPEQLDSKIQAVFGQRWSKYDWFNWLDEIGTQLMYGGLDHESVLERIKTLSGTGATVQTWLANDMACQIVPAQIAQPATERYIAAGLDPEGVGIRIAPSQFSFDNGQLLSSANISVGYGGDEVYEFGWGNDNEISATLNVTQAGNFELVLPYTNGNADPVYMQLYINDQLVADNLELASTNQAWWRWTHINSDSFYLPAGSHQIRLKGKGFSFTRIDSLFFRDIDRTDQQIRENIKELFYLFYGENKTTSDAEISDVVALYQQALASGLSAVENDQAKLNLEGDCQVSNHKKPGKSYPYEDVYDRHFYTRAWMATMTYMLKDLRFYYH
uniref:LamG-like jellyroll fold domain-containing protein n=1 Tax=Vibrio sp. TaxID=678 RepID=UPI003D0ACFAB